MSQCNNPGPTCTCHEQGLGISDPPSYGEAVSEAHRPNHTPTWEPRPAARICTLCGYIDTRLPTTTVISNQDRSIVESVLVGFALREIAAGRVVLWGTRTVHDALDRCTELQALDTENLGHTWRTQGSAEVVHDTGGILRLISVRQAGTGRGRTADTVILSEPSDQALLDLQPCVMGAADPRLFISRVEGT